MLVTLGAEWVKGIRRRFFKFKRGGEKEALPELHQVFKILSPDIHLQILQTDLQTFC